jgi:hypothetical protein
MTVKGHPMRAIFLLAAAIAFSGCNALYVQADEQRLCIVNAGGSQTFPGVPPLQLTLEQTFPLQLSDLTQSLPTGGDLQLHVYALEVDLTDPNGSQDFSGIQQASLSVTPPGQTSPVTLAAYTQDPANPPSTTLALLTPPAGQQLDLMTLADSSQNIQVTFDVSGTLPQNSWTAGINVCAKVSARFNYGDALAHGNLGSTGK